MCDSPGVTVTESPPSPVMTTVVPRATGPPPADRARCSLTSPAAWTDTCPTPFAGMATETTADVADQPIHRQVGGRLLRVEQLRELIHDARHHDAGHHADARRGRMGQLVVARDHATDAERREE